MTHSLGVLTATERHSENKLLEVQMKKKQIPAEKRRDERAPLEYNGVKVTRQSFTGRSPCEERRLIILLFYE